MSTASVDDGSNVTSRGWHGQLNGERSGVIRNLLRRRSEEAHIRVYLLQVFPEQICGLSWWLILDVNLAVLCSHLAA
jgi:hypothetical protein